MGNFDCTDMKSIFVYLGLFCSAFLSAVAGGSDTKMPEMARGAKFTKVEVPKDKAVVYVYRVNTLGVFNFPRVFINGDSIGLIKSHGYSIYYTDPGEVVIVDQLPHPPSGVVWTDIKRMAAFRRHALSTFNAQDGHEYYVVYEIGAFGFKMQLHDYEKAIKAIAKCRFGGSVSSGFAAKSTELPPLKGYSCLYLLNLPRNEFYRDIASESEPMIKIDGRKVGYLQYGTYLACYIPSGTHRVDADNGDIVNDIWSPWKNRVSSFTITTPLEEKFFFLWACVEGVVLESWRLEQLGHNAPEPFPGLKPGNSNYDVLIK